MNSVYVTKYAATRGIMKAELLDVRLGTAAVKFEDGTCALVEWDDWFESLARAFQHLSDRGWRLFPPDRQQHYAE